MRVNEMMIMSVSWRPHDFNCECARCLFENCEFGSWLDEAYLSDFQQFCEQYYASREDDLNKNQKRAPEEAQIPGVTPATIDVEGTVRFRSILE